jgi:hypothetical protein
MRTQLCGGKVKVRGETLPTSEVEAFWRGITPAVL